ncbi:hypothetical protein [Zavarzinella formosa]|uniref:hypothetical protein n=1 Tax=Zavarzinella formosa TaxID=360055 RepID=UPI0004978E6C|nr:hypothetical protein [Zavarzinella formosa]
MPETFESRERVVRLETQMENLTSELSDVKDAVKELTTALHELKGAFRGAMWLGGVIAAGMGAVAWMATWLYDKFGG